MVPRLDDGVYLLLRLKVMENGYEIIGREEGDFIQRSDFRAFRYSDSFSKCCIRK